MSREELLKEIEDMEKVSKNIDIDQRIHELNVAELEKVLETIDIDREMEAIKTDK